MQLRLKTLLYVMLFSLTTGLSEQVFDDVKFVGNPLNSSLTHDTEKRTIRCAESRHKSRSFEIDFENNRFLKDGQPFRYVSGSIHYYRVHPTDWRDRLHKMRYAGLNAVQMYVEWASHEPEPGQFEFAGSLDLGRFLREAQEEDLLVILRAGPYICAERDMGGLPYWLLREHPNIRLRSSDPNFLRHVDHWFLNGLFPVIKPYLYENGGPIIMIQLENEYGNYYACDYKYTAHLRQLFRVGLGRGVVLFTTDNAVENSLRCGKIQHAYATVDFGIDASPLVMFGAQRLFEPEGPLVNSEFYSGWLDHWGQPHQTKDAFELSTALNHLLKLNASVNIYMFHGGTNFGLSSGSNLDGGFKSCPTSYDYDAPISEAGDLTTKYFAVRDVISKYLPLPQGPPPANSSKAAYGSVPLRLLGDLVSLSSSLHLESVYSKYPLSFEQLNVSSGLVVYSTVITELLPDPAVLKLGALHDRGYLFVNRERRLVAYRGTEIRKLPLSVRVGDHLSIIVESMGRVSVGTEINDFKGLTSNVSIGDYVLTNWTMTPVPVLHLNKLVTAVRNARHEYRAGHTAGLFEGFLQIPSSDEEPRDTFVRLDGWTKGIIWVNGFCLGRYWPVMGPQATLYVPHGILRQGVNSVHVLELESANCSPLHRHHFRHFLHFNPLLHSADSAASLHSKHSLHSSHSKLSKDSPLIKKSHCKQCHRKRSAAKRMLGTRRTTRCNVVFTSEPDINSLVPED